MVDQPTLRCPVCRARQPWQPTCRRCRADLRLLVAALDEVERLQRCQAAAIAAGDSAAAQRVAETLREMLGNRADQAPPPPGPPAPPQSFLHE